MEQTPSSARFGWQHFAVAGAGLLTLVLLVVASKTALNNNTAGPSASGEQSDTRPAQPPPKQGDNQVALFGLIPEVSAEGRTGQLMDSLKNAGADNDQRAILLRQLVEELQRNKRLDAAAIYAGTLADLKPDFKNRLVAGALFRNSMLIPPVSEDSVAFRKWCTEAIRNLEIAISMDSTSEDAKIELGLAYAQSGQQEQNMKGIMLIRDVADKNPKNEEAAWELGRFSMQTGQFEKAEMRLRVITKTNPRYLQARFLLAQALKEQGKKAESKQIFQELASQKENSEIAASAQAELIKP